MGSEKSWNFVASREEQTAENESTGQMDFSIDDALIRDVLRDLEFDKSADFCSDNSNNVEDLDLLDVMSTSEVEIKDHDPCDEASSSSFNPVPVICLSILTALIIKGLSTRENMDRLKRLATHVLEHNAN